MDIRNIDQTQKIKRTPGEKDKKTIPMVCSWCGKLYRFTTWEVEYNKRIGTSHGICEACLERQSEELKKSTK